MPHTAEEADQLITRATVDSTNFTARHLIDKGQLMPRRDGRLTIMVVAADMQTNGHGRLGREWVNVPGESFTVSFATVVPRALATDGSVNGWIQMTAGLASLDAIRGALEAVGSQSIKPDCPLSLKWPNDVFCHGLKLGGILCELVPLPHGGDAVSRNCNGAEQGQMLPVLCRFRMPTSMIISAWYSASASISPYGPSACPRLIRLPCRCIARVCPKRRRCAT